MNKPEQKKRGAGIATALIVAVLMLSLGFTVAAVAFNHLNVSSRLSNVAQAENLAESAISKVIEQMMLDQTYGTAGSETQVITLAGAPTGARGVVTFSTTDAGTYGIDRSFQNLAGTSDATADNGVVVPKEAVYIVGLGECAGVQRKIECLVYMPRFPYSIASSGPVSGSGLFVAGLRDGAVVPYGSPPADDDLLPGHLASNDSSASAVQLTNDNTVTGDIRSSGGAALSTYNAGTGTGTRVDGEQILYASDTNIPDVDIPSFQPNLADPAVNQSYSSVESALTVSGEGYYSGTMNINNGLTLDQGVLYVDGDLTVTGGVHGKGALIVTGNLSITGGGSASTDNTAALLSGGNFSMVGDTGDVDTARFEGLVYTEGDFDISDMTVQGVFVANKSGGSNMSMSNVRMYQQEEHSSVTVEPSTGVHPLALDTMPTNTTIPDGSGTGILMLTTPAVTGFDASATWDAGLGFHKITYDDGTGNFFYMAPGSPTPIATGGPVSFAATVSSTNPLEFQGTSYIDRNALKSAIQSFDPAITDAVADSFIDRAAAKQGFAAALRFGLDGYGGGSTTPPPPVGGATGASIFEIALSDFLNPVNRMRILYWKVQSN